jgi:hypothetical protein
MSQILGQESGGRAYQAVPCPLCKGGHTNRRREWWSARKRAHAVFRGRKRKIMSIQSGSLQTPATDALGQPNVVLDGKVTGMDVLDPTENDEKTTLLEVDDEFDVVLSWELDGAATTVVGGYWIVSLYSDDMDGVGTMNGRIAGPDTIAIVGGVTPLKFEHTFKVYPPKPQIGLYKLTATINHSPTGKQNQLTEMFGFAESTPVQIVETTVESN